MTRLARSAAATAALFVPLAVLDRRMQRAGGPGIIGFEVAGTPERARAIMDAWGEEGRAAARASLVLDFPFLIAYTGVNVALAPGRGLAAVAVVAGACDAVENAALLGVLAGRDGRLPAVARAFALAKFALLGIGWGATARRTVR